MKPADMYEVFKRLGDKKIPLLDERFRWQDCTGCEGCSNCTVPLFAQSVNALARQ